MKLFFLLTFLWISVISKAQIKFPKIEGLETQDTIEIYNQDNLWEYINGAAASYVKYGFNNLKIKEYTLASGDYILAEIYEHASPIKAFGIYSFEKPSQTHFIKIAGQGYIEGSNINFYGGNYYIKIIANNNNTETIEIIQKLAKAIEKENYLTSNKIPELDAFPPDSLISNSEKFFPANYLGHSFLSDVLEASYSIKGQTIKLFAIIKKDQQQASECIKNYLEFTKQEIDIKENTPIYINDIFNGLIVMKLKNSTIYGVSGTVEKDLSEEILSKF